MGRFKLVGTRLEEDVTQDTNWEVTEDNKAKNDLSFLRLEDTFHSLNCVGLVVEKVADSCEGIQFHIRPFH